MASHEPPKRRRRSRATGTQRSSVWRDTGWGEPTARAGLAMVVIGAPLLLGGGPAWAIVVIAAVSLVCLAWAAFGAPARNQTVPFLGVVMCVCTLWTALQACPLPCSWVAALAPESARQVAAAAAALGQPSPSLCALSRDPGATQQEIIKGVAIVATFLAAWLYASSCGRRNILWLIAWSSLAMALVALAHAAFQIDRIFGIYTPISVKREILLAPLMNPNHLGGFVALGAPLWIGLTCRDNDIAVRLLGYVAVFVVSLTTALTMSRGAIGQLLTSLLFMSWIAATQVRRNVASGVEATHRVGLAAAIACGLGTTAYFLGDEIARQFNDNDTSKFQLIARSLRFALSHLWLGVGRGAFSSAFVAFEGKTVRFVYAENFVVQWLSEWGLPVTALLLASLVMSIVRAYAGKASIARFGAITGIACYAAQNLVDFGFEQLGVAVVMAALLAASLAPSSRRDSPSDRPWHLRSTTVSGVVVALGSVALIFLGPTLSRHQVRPLEVTLRSRMKANDQVGVESTLATAVELHPSEPLFAIIGAANGIRRRDSSAGRWLNRAMQLAPGWAVPHYLAYRWLWQSGKRSQALLELRTATEIDVYPYRQDICLLVERSPQLAVLAAPIGNLRRTYLELATQCVPPGHPSETIVNDALLRAEPGSALGLERRALDLDRSGHTDEGLAVLEELLRVRPADERALGLRAHLFARAGRTEQALEAADKALAVLEPDRRGEILKIKAFSLARMGAPEPASAAVAEVRRLAGTDVHQLAESFALEGRVDTALGHPGQAFRAFREAYRIDQDPGRLLDLARLAESLGDRPQALWAYAQLCQQEPHGGGCARRDQLLAPRLGDLSQ